MEKWFIVFTVLMDAMTIRSFFNYFLNYSNINRYSSYLINLWYCYLCDLSCKKRCKYGKLLKYIKNICLIHFKHFNY